MIRSWLIAALAGAVAVPPMAQTFRDVTAAAGIDYVQFRRADHTPAAMQSYKTGGVAAGDYDGDGLVDLYVTRLDDRDILYRNRGDGTFADVTSAAFGPDHLAEVQSNGATWGDIDNDGDLDLYVTSLFSQRFHLFVNDGAGSFTEEAVARGAATEGEDLHFGFSAAFGDYDLDGYLDLHTTEWRFLRQMTVGAQSNARLLRNRGREAPGTFEDVTRHAGVSQHRIIAVNPLAEGQTLTSSFTMLDDDLYPELVIAGDHHTSQLYWNLGDGRFINGTIGARVGTDEYGMGSAVGDFDGDGRLDWFVSAIYEEGVPYRDGNRLYRNLGRGFFEDATDAAGVRDGSWGGAPPSWTTTTTATWTWYWPPAWTTPTRCPTPPIPRASPTTRCGCGATTAVDASPRLRGRRGCWRPASEPDWQRSTWSRTATRTCWWCTTAAARCCTATRPTAPDGRGRTAGCRCGWRGGWPTVRGWARASA